MNEPPFVPALPENAPFTPEQRAYLNGFLAGLFSRLPAVDVEGNNPQSGAPLAPLSILFGSQTGNAENLAKRIAKEAGKRGFAPTVHDLAKYPIAQLASEPRLLIVTSTYGDGEPPDNAKTFWEHLNDQTARKMPQTQFSICALGDTNYPKFCGFGKDLDARFVALGAQCVYPRADCDVDFEESFARWLDGALNGLAGSGAENVTAKLETHTEEPSSKMSASVFSRANPFPAPLATNRSLNGPGSEKDTRHFEISLGGSGLTYEVGDALGVYPANCPELVAEILARLGFSGDEPVPGRDGSEIPARESFLRHYEIAKVSPAFLSALAELSRDENLKRLTAPDANGELSKFLREREVIDLLLQFPAVKFSPVEFVKLLKKLQPRLYSISSSPKAHPGQAHLTVSVLRYESLGRQRKGVCSTFLAERVKAGAPVPVFVHGNKNFKPPANDDLPMIMVGPGTGVAPFRAFLQERRTMGAKGKNWLIFGDQHAATDFIYREELEAMLRDGVLARLDTAFSRDQPEKLYVQHRMREHAGELFKWLEEGAHFYVCGDANCMAKDVDAALHEVIQMGGRLTAQPVREYVQKLKREKRYQRDVY